MGWFTTVSSGSKRSMPRIGFGAVADSSGALTPKIYLIQDSARQTALVKSDPFLDAVLGRNTTGSAGAIPSPGSSYEAPGILPSKSDWLTWAADSVRDRLDLSAGFSLSAWKSESSNLSTLLGASEPTAPTDFPTVSSTYREALASGMTGLLAGSVSGETVAQIYAGLIRGKAVSPVFSIWG